MVSEEAGINLQQAGVFLLRENSQSARLPLIHSSGYEMTAGQESLIAYDMSGSTAQDPGTYYGTIGTGLYPALQQFTHQGFLEIKPLSKPGINNKVMAPGITSFSPTTVRAGAMWDPANNVLTINGTNFGPSAGNAAVYFDDPNDGTGGSYTVIPFSSQYVINWSPTQIVIRVPGGTGTGLIGVRDNAGNLTLSSSSLKVEFSVLSFTHPSFPVAGAYQPKLMNKNGTGGYDFLYSTSTAGGGADFTTASEKAPFERALDTWQKITGVNFIVAGTTSSQTVANDGVNIVELDNTNTGVGILGANVLGQTFISARACSNGSNWEIYDIDMVFRHAGVSGGPAIAMANGPCPPASTEADFETVMLHELGHAHTFQHVNDGPAAGDPAKVMNYAVFLGTLRRSPDASAYGAGLYSLQPSGLSYGTCLGFPNAEMTPLTTSVPGTNSCPGSFPSSPTPPGVTIIDNRYATSDKNVDPSTSQIVCSGTSGIYNTVYFPFQTNSVGGNLTALISSYSTLVDYSTCSGMGVRMTLYQLSACPGGQSFPAPLDCRIIDNSGNLSPAGEFAGLAANTNYLFVFDGIKNTKASFNLTLGGAALPVKLMDFTGKLEGAHAWLNWHTSYELNSRGFEIERSYDGINFSPIGFVPSLNSNTNSLSEYQFEDPALAQQLNFYRLKQIDRDGNFEYSKVVVLQDPGIDGVFRILQNPFQQALDLQFERPVRGKVEWRLMDMNGIALVQGNSQVNGTSRMHIDLSRESISNGIYLFQVRTPDHTYVKKLLKD